MDPITFRDDCVRPALEALNAWTTHAEMLVMGTAAVESGLKYTRQMGDGPALGYFQMEPDTFNDCWTNYLDFRPVLKALVLCTRNGEGPPNAEEMVTDHKFAAAMCRVRYMRVPSAIPIEPKAMAGYWKQHYNTVHGKGDSHHFVASWNRLLAPALYARID